MENYLGEIEESVQSIKASEERSIIFRNEDKYYLHINSDVRYPMTNSGLLYDNLLFEIKINDMLVNVDGIDHPFFISSNEEKNLKKEIRGVEAPIFLATGSVLELRPMDFAMKNMEYLYKYFIGLDSGPGYIYSLLISNEFNKIYEEVMTFPTKYVVLGK